MDADQGPIGESWEVSAVPGSESIIDNGDFAGRSLNDYIVSAPRDILGRRVALKYHNQLPLLAKFIDADHDLSIQVHPDDAMAMREHGKMGKSEMWYVIDAEPGAYLYAGFSRELSQQEYRERVANGTICEVLAKHEVHPGDVFYLPAGRIHAICGGILLAEIQQSSDVTYRIFDYNRLGLDGRPRQLHTDLAVQALDFQVHPTYRTTYRQMEDRANPILSSPHFSVRVERLCQPMRRNLKKYDSFVIVMCVKGQCEIRIRPTGAGVRLTEGNSCFIPAAIADYDVIPTPSVQLLDAYIDNRSLLQRLLS